MRKDRFLITTADEKTWKMDAPVLFLGEWCKIFNRPHVWTNLDSEVVPYHWDDRVKFNQDYSYLSVVYEQYLQELAAQLNEIHQVEHELRYWRILVGPWLTWFIQIIFDRWSMLEKAFSEFTIVGIKTRQAARKPYIAQDMRGFIKLALSEQWNEAIYTEILTYFQYIQGERVANDEVCRLPTVPSSSMKQIIKKALNSTVHAVIRPLRKEGDAFFMGTHLSFERNCRLQLKLGQMPTFWQEAKVPLASVDMAKRLWTLDERDDPFSRLVSSMLPKHLPLSYLEGYSALQKELTRLPWPKKPRLIFTANIYADDIFKAWTAKQVQAGAKLIVAQHGGGYGTSKKMCNEEHEVAIADKYLTWGWNDKKHSHVSPAFTSSKRLSLPKRKAEHILLVSNAYPRLSYKLTSEAISSQWLAYFDEQCSFVALLPAKLQKKIIVRLAAQDYGWCQKERWENKDFKIQVDTGMTPLPNLINDCKLLVSTYNATNFLESLSNNIPTMMFCDPNVWELRDEAVSYFNRLKQVGILHETPHSAAAKVEEVWNDVGSWWKQAEIQEARAYFCQRFARQYSKKSSDFLKNALKEA